MRYGRNSTQHFIPHSVPLTHIRKNVPNGMKHTEKKPLQKPKPCMKRYKGIKEKADKQNANQPYQDRDKGAR